MPAPAARPMIAMPRAAGRQAAWQMGGAGWWGAGLLMTLAPGVMGVLVGAPSPGWAACSGALAALGLVAIRLTRGRWLSAPLLMLLLCTLGMAIGLPIDRLWAGPEVLASVCAAGSGGFVESLLRHAEVLRATSLAMLAGGLATIGVVEWRARRLGRRCRKAVCGRAGFNLMCNAAMAGGMLTGSWFGPAAARSLALTWDSGALVAMMVVGMVWGMAGSMALYRTGFALRDRVRPMTRSGGPPPTFS